MRPTRANQNVLSPGSRVLSIHQHGSHPANTVGRGYAA